MEITKELVERIARLAQLTLSEEEKERMSTQLADILGSMTALESLKLEEEEQGQEQTNVLRSDTVGQSMERTALLDNAPRQEDGYILVPGAIGQGEQE